MLTKKEQKILEEIKRRNYLGDAKIYGDTNILDAHRLGGKDKLVEVSKKIDNWLNKHCTHKHRVGQDNCLECVKELKEDIGI